MTDVVLISLLLVPLQIAADQLGLKTVLGRWASALIYLLLSFALFAYYILFEGLNRGRTPGKILLGIRVVMDTGRPITLAAAALRNLVRAAEYAALLLPAALTMLLHRSNKRLGDLDRKSTRLNSSHLVISYAVFCLKKKKKDKVQHQLENRIRALYNRSLP